MTNRNNKNFGRALSLLTLSLFCFYVFYWLIKATLYSHPNAEDLSLSHPVFNAGAEYFIRHTLASYDGRYFVNILHTITPLAFGFTKGYPIVAIIGMIAFIASLWFFFSSIFQAHPLSLLFLSVLFASVHFAIVPSIVHQLFWMSSSLVYLWSWIFALFFIGAFVRVLISSKRSHKTINSLLAAFFLWAALGINEMMLPFFVVLFLVLIYFNLHNKNIRPLIFFFLFALILMLFFITSPGIIERVATEQKDRVTVSFFLKFKYGLRDNALYLWSTFSQPMFLCSSILMVVFTPLFLIKQSVKNLFQFTHSFIIISVAVFTSFCMTLTYYLPIGDANYFPTRIYNSVLVLIMIIVLISIIHFAKKIKVSTFSQYFSALMLFFSVFFSNNNIANIKKDFRSGVVVSFHQEMENRNHVLDSIAKTNNCYKIALIKDFQLYPQSISMPPDMLSERQMSHWNNAYEMYYQIDRLALKTDTCCFHL